MKKLLVSIFLLSSLTSMAQDKDTAFIIQENINQQQTIKFYNKIGDLKQRKNLSKEFSEFIDLALSAQQIEYKKWERCQNELYTFKPTDEYGVQINTKTKPKPKVGPQIEIKNDSTNTSKN